MLNCDIVVKEFRLQSHYYIAFLTNTNIGLVGRVFANGPGDRGSIPGRTIQKT